VSRQRTVWRNHERKGRGKKNILKAFKWRVVDAPTHVDKKKRLKSKLRGDWLNGTKSTGKAYKMSKHWARRRCGEFSSSIRVARQSKR